MTRTAMEPSTPTLAALLAAARRRLAAALRAEGRNQEALAAEQKAAQLQVQ